MPFSATSSVKKLVCFRAQNLFTSLNLQRNQFKPMNNRRTRQLSLSTLCFLYYVQNNAVPSSLKQFLHKNFPHLPIVNGFAFPLPFLSTSAQSWDKSSSLYILVQTYNLPFRRSISGSELPLMVFPPHMKCITSVCREKFSICE